MSDYTIRALETPEEITEEAQYWCDHVRSGFHDSWSNEQVFDYWWRAVLTDGQRLRGAYRSTTTLSWQVPDPIGTLASLDGTVNTGGGHLEPANFITDVTVRPTHRRRGLLRMLMETDLRAAKERGLSLASLTASEGGIYRRFGFGVATSLTSVEIDTTARFQLRREIDQRVELADPRLLTPVRKQVFAAFHASHTGSHSRLWHYEPLLSGEWDLERACPNPKLRAAVHLDETGQPDGIVTYEVNQPVAKIWEFVATCAEAELGLWQFLAGIDLVTSITFNNYNPQSPLRYALVDPRVVKVVRFQDFTWTRILDVGRALSVRSYDGRRTVTLRIVDPLGLSDGTWMVDSTGEVAVVEQVDTAPEVTMDISTLGEIYHGLTPVFSLAGAGDIVGDTQAITKLSRLFSTDELPYNLTAF